MNKAKQVDFLHNFILRALSRLKRMELEKRKEIRKIPEIIKFLMRLENSQILLIDGDNVPSMADILINITDEYGDPVNLQIIVFVALEANFKKINDLATTKSWVRIFRAFTKAKNACDTSISMLALWLALHTNGDNSISIFTRDGFALETIEFIKMICNERIVNWINMNEFQFYLSRLTYRKRILPIRTVVAVRDSQNGKPNKTPSNGYVCKYCKYPGGHVDSHWSQTCHIRRGKIQAATPEIGYACKYCGKKGGETDSHWFQHCPFISK